MTDEEILTLTKADLQLTTSLRDEYIKTLIAASKTSIERTGISLDLKSVDDCVTVTMYAAYLYRKRIDASNPMPEMLTYRLRNRLWQQKMTATVSS